jgi:hypothetical protein
MFDCTAHISSRMLSTVPKSPGHYNHDAGFVIEVRFVTVITIIHEQSLEGYAGLHTHACDVVR